MATTITAVVLDPVEVATARTEVALNTGAINVAEEGLDWGDAQIEAYMAQAGRGQLPVDFRVPNRIITIPLLLGATGRAGFAAAKAQLQAKVALFQQEGGWLKRGSGLYADIVNATLKLPDHYASRGIEADVVLTLEAIPDFYGDEITLPVRSSSGDISFVEDIDGDYPGRVRITVQNGVATAQAGLIGGFRGRHYSAATTARLVYEAEAMTPLDAAFPATLAGAYGSNVMRHNNLGTDWTPVMNTNQAGVYLTHTGSYRVWARVYSISGSAVRARLLWDVGDLTHPEENDPVTIPLASQFWLADLGEIRLDRAPVGPHRWLGQIQARGAVGGEEIRIDRVYFQPIDEGAWRLSTPASFVPGLDGYAVRDPFNHTAGNLSGKTAPAGGVWAFAGDTDPVTIDTATGTAKRTAVSDAGEFVGRYEVAATSMGTMVSQVDVKAADFPVGLSTSRGHGVLARYNDINNWLMGKVQSDFRVYLRVGGGTPTELFRTSQPRPTNAFYSIRLAVDAAGRWSVWYFPQGSDPGEPLASGVHSALVSGTGALGAGKAGLYDVQTGSVSGNGYYDNMLAWAPTANAVMFPSRAAELTTDGMFRYDSTGTALGPLTPIGDLPRIPVSGLENRFVETFLKWSRGDLADQSDPDNDPATAQIRYRPSWLFPPG